MVNRFASQGIIFITACILLTSPALAGAIASPISTQNRPARTQLSERPTSATPPSITTQPVSQTVAIGQAATFTVVAAGSAPLTYQWNANGTPIDRATSPSYTIQAAAPANDGTRFSVTISNPAGSITSASAALTVTSVSLSSQSPAPDAAHKKPTLGERFLINSYVGLQLGSINYPFSSAQLQPGFQAQSVQVPHLAVRVTLYGHEFNKYFSVQITEMRPVLWVLYKNVNGDMFSHSVWMNVGGLTGKARLPLTGKFSIFGEAGLGLVTRHGFSIGPSQVVSGHGYPTILFGGGAEYSLNDRWSLLASVAALPGNGPDKQPHTIFFSGGFDYTLRRIPSKVIAEDDVKGPRWPKNILQVGYITDAAGFGVNHFVSKTVPIFWPGDVYVANGFSVSFERNILHTRRWFALDWGAELSTWSSRMNRQRFSTAALYPVLRFPLVRTNPVEWYFSYSLAGPALISRTNIDDQPVGRTFTFQDYMSFGFYFGKKRQFAADIRITHYSNGNLFTQNPGITVPLGFYFGTTF